MKFQKINPVRTKQGKPHSEFLTAFGKVAFCNAKCLSKIYYGVNQKVEKGIFNSRGGSFFFYGAEIISFYIFI